MLPRSPGLETAVGRESCLADTLHAGRSYNGLGVRSALISPHAEILSTQEDKPGGSRAGGQPGLYLKAPSYQSN